MQIKALNLRKRAIISLSSTPHRTTETMKPQHATFLKLSTLLISLGFVSACAVVAPLPSNGDNAAQGDASEAVATSAPASLCNIEGEETQDLKDGTTTATIKQSCERTEVTIQNNHKQHAKKCKVIIGQSGSELYVQSGESRTLTQTGPVQKDRIGISCVNDWNRPK